MTVNWDHIDSAMLTQREGGQHRSFTVHKIKPMEGVSLDDLHDLEALGLTFSSTHQFFEHVKRLRFSLQGIQEEELEATIDETTLDTSPDHAHDVDVPIYRAGVRIGSVVLAGTVPINPGQPAQT